MMHTTDIEKLYSLIDSNPDDYKEIRQGKEKEKAARMNWPMMRAISAQPIVIPPVKNHEKFETRLVTVQNLRPETEQIVQNKIQIPEAENLSIRVLTPAPELVPVQPVTEFVHSHEVPKPMTLDSTVFRIEEKLSRREHKLGNMFKRLEAGPHGQGRNSNLLKLRLV
jgi:hypothetical protein